jgi:predicted MFS family arabinose efflux permease
MASSTLQVEAPRGTELKSTVRPGAWPVTLVGLLGLMAGLGFGRFSYTMLLPSTRTGLDISYTAAGFLGTANLAGYLAGSLASGMIMRRFGAPVTATGGLIALAIGLVWMGYAHGLADAALARTLAGAAGAVVYVQALGLIAGWFPARKRGLASGIMHSGNGLGLILTGLGLPILIATGTDGWRAGWIALGLATLVVAPLAWFRLRLPKDHTPTAPTTAKIASPARRLAGSSAVMEYGILYALFGLSYVIYVTFFAEVLRSWGLPLSNTGMVWAVVGLLSMTSGALAGALSDRIGRRRGLAVLFSLQALSYMALLSGNGWPLVVSVALFGFTAWGIPAIMAAAMSDVGRAEDAMAAFGRITAIMGIGQAAGPVLAGTAVDLTGIVGSGLYVSTAAALCAAAWIAARGAFAGVPQRAGQV